MQCLVRLVDIITFKTCTNLRLTKIIGNTENMVRLSIVPPSNYFRNPTVEAAITLMSNLAFWTFVQEFLKNGGNLNSDIASSD